MAAPGSRILANGVFGADRVGQAVSAHLRRGFCPSLWTPMESGDGLLVRVQAGARALAADALRELCRLADAHGNGLIEITRRAKLQLRGVRAEGLPVLQRELVALGLASASEELERRTALVVDPLAGLDARSVPLETVVAEIEDALAGDASLRGLSSKFGVAVDASGVLRDIAADIRVEVSPERTVLCVPDSAGRWISVGALESGIANAVSALARLLAQSEHRRMRELVAAVGVGPLARLMAAGSTVLADARSSTPTVDGSWNVDATVDVDDLLGLHSGPPSWLGAALPFGSGTTAQWRALTLVAEQLGGGSVRVTPFRGVILPDAAEAAAAPLAAAGWIIDPADPLLRVTACPGAPACRSAAGDTRSLGRTLAPLMAAGTHLHVTGCEKGCAHDGPSDVTLLRARDGVKLGFGMSAAQAAALPSTSVQSVQAALARLAQH